MKTQANQEIDEITGYFDRMSHVVWAVTIGVGLVWGLVINVL